MKQNKDFWNGYIAHKLAEQFSFWDGHHEWSRKIDKILHLYHAEIIQLCRNFNKYATPLYELKEEAESKLNGESSFQSIEKLLIQWCNHMINVLSMGEKIALKLGKKIRYGLIDYNEAIWDLEQEIARAYQYIMMMRIDKLKEDVKD
jgi:hypothetical protein